MARESVPSGENFPLPVPSIRPLLVTKSTAVRSSPDAGTSEYAAASTGAPSAARQSDRTISRLRILFFIIIASFPSTAIILRPR